MFIKTITNHMTNFRVELILDGGEMFIHEVQVALFNKENSNTHPATCDVTNNYATSCKVKLYCSYPLRSCE